MLLTGKGMMEYRLVVAQFAKSTSALPLRRLCKLAELQLHTYTQCSNIHFGTLCWNCNDRPLHFTQEEEGIQVLILQDKIL